MTPRRSAVERLRAWHGQNLQALSEARDVRLLQVVFLQRRHGIVPGTLRTDEDWQTLKDRWLQELGPRPNMFRGFEGTPPGEHVMWAPLDAAGLSGLRGADSDTVIVDVVEGVTHVAIRAHVGWRRLTDPFDLVTAEPRFAIQIQLLARRYSLPEEVVLWAVLDPEQAPARLAGYLDRAPWYPVRWHIRWMSSEADRRRLREAAKASRTVQAACGRLVPGLDDRSMWNADQSADDLDAFHLLHRRDGATGLRLRADAPPEAAAAPPPRRRPLPANFFRIVVEYPAAVPEEAIRAAWRAAKSDVQCLSQVLGGTLRQRHRVSRVLSQSATLALPTDYNPHELRDVDAYVLDTTAALDGEAATDTDLPVLRHRLNNRRHRVRQQMHKRYGDDV